MFIQLSIPADIKRIVLGVSYNGTAYHGWQKQARVLSLQAVLEKALSQIADHPVMLVCAGRTDKGVHARQQVLHFDTSAIRTSQAWIAGTNTYLPADIKVNWALQTTADFHARFSAVSRRYQYFIWNYPSPPPCFSQQMLWFPASLNYEKLQEASQFLLGSHDFSAFRGADCQAKSAIRTVLSIAWQQQGPNFCFSIEANAFLHHMVRNIVGSLLMVGQGKKAIGWIATVLQSRSRMQAGKMAPSQGLYLSEVIYPSQFLIPASPPWPYFF